MLWKKSKNTPRFSFSAVFLFLLSFIFTLSPFCISSVSAVDLNFDVVPIAYSNKQAVDTIVSTCPVNNLTYGYSYNTGNNACDFTSFTQTLNNSWGFSNKYYFKLDVVLYESRDREPLDAYTNFPPTLAIKWAPQSGMPTVNTLITFVGLNTSQVSEGTTVISYYYKVPDDMSYGILYGYTANVHVGVQVNELARVYGFSAYAENSTNVNVNQQQVVDAIEALDVTIQQNAGASASDMESIIGDLSTDITSSLSDNTSAVEEQTEVISDMNDYMQDDTPPELSEDSTDALADSAGWLPAGPVDSILTLPITFMQQIVNVLTGSDNCSPVEVPLPTFMNSNQKIILPCMRPIINQMGFLAIYEVVGGVVAMFIIWDTLKWLYEFVDKTLTFREDNSSIWGGL